MGFKRHLAETHPHLTLHVLFVSSSETHKYRTECEREEIIRKARLEVERRTPSIINIFSFAQSYD